MNRQQSAPEALDRAEWQAERNLAEYRRRAEDRAWLSDAIEALLGLTGWREFLNSYAAAVNEDALQLGVPPAQAKPAADRAIDAHVATGRRYIDAMTRAVRFALPAARDAAARRVDLRFGSPCAPAVDRTTLILHFGPEMAEERLRRWTLLIAKCAALAPKTPKSPRHAG